MSDMQISTDGVNFESLNGGEIPVSNKAKQSPSLEMNLVAFKFKSPHLDIESVHGKLIAKFNREHLTLQQVNELVETLDKLHEQVHKIGCAL